ncbi:MAG: hypothetical protein IKG14_00825 [Clostridia bacterium]|nr:hypothetical protein [Clostridia bacterium]MBR3324579.1 hypothetical protein [Clostridia bacterium]
MKDIAFTKILSWSKIQGEAQGFIERGGNGEIDISKAQADLLPIGNILMGIGIAVLLVVGPIMGVKYMLSGADEKANMKQKLIWFVIAAVLIFGAGGIYNIVVSLINSSGI